MRLRYVLLVAAGMIAAAIWGSARADINYTQGSGTVIFDFTCFTTKHCPSHVNVNSAGTEIMTTANPGQIDASTSSQLHADLTAALPAGGNTIGAVNQAGTWTVQVGNTPNTSPILVSGDPCQQITKSGATINLTGSGQIITGTSAKKTYICSIDIVTATAQNIALVEGTGSVCATNIFGLAGGTTAATGWNLSANGGLTKGSGSGTVYSPSADANASAANVCLLLSSSGQTSGHITYVQQ